MIHRGLLLLGLLLSIPVAGIAEPRVDVRPARTDAFGDPLPPGALARLGTIRWRTNEPIQNVAFSPDGKRVIAAGGSSILLFEFPSGRILRQYAIPMQGGIGPMVFTADGKSVIVGVSANSSAISLDLATGRTREIIPGSPNAGANEDPGGPDIASGGRWGLKWVNDGFNYRITLHDLSRRERGREIAKLICADEAQVVGTISSQGRFAAVLASVPNNNQTSRLTLIETATGRFSSISLPPAPGQGSCAFTADEKELVCIAGKMLLRWEVKPASKPKGLPEWQLLQRHNFPQTGLNALTLLPDGKRFLAVDCGEGTTTLWNTANGKLLKVWSMRNLVEGEATPQVALSPDGKIFSISSSVESSVRFWDIDTRRELFRTSGHRGTIGDLQFHPNGRVLTSVGEEGEIRIWDLTPKRIAIRATEESRVEEVRYAGREWAVLKPRRGDGDFNHVAFADNGNCLFGQSLNGNVWSWQTANRTASKEVVPTVEQSSAFAASTDGKIVAVTVQTGGIKLFDTEKAQPLEKQPAVVEPIADFFFTPSSSRLSIVTISGQLIYWDCSAGKELLPGADFKPHQGQIERYRMAFNSTEGRLELWDRTAGRVVRHLDNLAGPYALSPDGRYIVHTSSLNGLMTLSETVSMLTVQQWPVQQGIAQAVQFSPDGKLLALGYNNGTILLWDTRSPVPKTKPDAGAIETAWNDLASNQQDKPFKAIGVLQAAPKEALTLLKEKLRPSEPVDAIALMKLFRKLDDDRYAVRQRAMFQLMEIADRVDGDIHHRYAVASEEARWRLDRVLASTTRLVTDSETLRRLRAVEVLERIGTAEAKALLKKLADGRDGLVERSARDALTRFDR